MRATDVVQMCDELKFANIKMLRRVQDILFTTIQGAVTYIVLYHVIFQVVKLMRIWVDSQNCR